MRCEQGRWAVRMEWRSSRFRSTLHRQAGWSRQDNWIEAYHLLDGIGQFLILDGGCDAEVLQFVVEEVDDVGRLLVVQLEQGLAERHIIICMRDTLGEGAKWHAEDAGHERQSI